jgi:hypothetical protein
MAMNITTSGCSMHSDTEISETSETINESTVSAKVFDVNDPAGFSIDYNCLSENEKLIYNYIDVINTGDPSMYADFYVPSFQESYKNLYTNPELRAANMGILNLNYTKLIYIQKKDSQYIPYYRELETFSDDNLECYLVGLDVRVNEENQYYYNGVMYKLIILGNENGTWGVATESGFSVELVAELEGQYPTFDALNWYWQRVYGEPYEVGKVQEPLQ